MNWNTFKRTVYFVSCCSIRAYVNVDSIHFNWIASHWIELLKNESAANEWAKMHGKWSVCSDGGRIALNNCEHKCRGVICMHNFWNNALRFCTMALCCSFVLHRGLLQLQFTPVLRVNNLMSLVFSLYPFCRLVVSFPFSTWICHALLLTRCASRWEIIKKVRSTNKSATVANDRQQARRKGALLLLHQLVFWYWRIVFVYRLFSATHGDVSIDLCTRTYRSLFKH